MSRRRRLLRWLRHLVPEPDLAFAEGVAVHPMNLSPTEGPPTPGGPPPVVDRDPATRTSE